MKKCQDLSCFKEYQFSFNLSEINIMLFIIHVIKSLHECKKSNIFVNYRKKKLNH